MTTSMSFILKLKSFLSTVVDYITERKKGLVVCESHTSLEQAYRLRHCPTGYDDLGLIYTTLYETFGDIQDTDLFRTLLGEMQYAKIPGCRSWTTQANLPKVPDHLDAPFESTIITGADRLSYTVWVLWFEDSVRVVKPYPNRGIYRSNIEVFESTERADKTPEGVVQAAKITIGVVEADNLLKGYQWMLYRNHTEV